jgi:hypothetical protein
MDFNATVDLIIKDLHEARDIIDDFKNYPEIPVLQIELAKSKCKSAAEVIALLKSSSHTPADTIKVESFVRTEVKKSVSSEIIPPSPKQEIISQPAPAPVIEPQVPKKKSLSKAIVADTFNNLPGRLNEQLGGNRDDDDISGIIKTKHLVNLSDAIGINDKFIFIREIFNGNTEIFNNTISRLELAQDFTDAEKIISDYAGDNSDNAAFRQLVELVKRKFTSDE